MGAWAGGSCAGIMPGLAGGGGHAMAGPARCRGGAGPAPGSGGWPASFGAACCRTCVDTFVGGGASGSEAFSDVLFVGRAVVVAFVGAFGVGCRSVGGGVGAAGATGCFGHYGGRMDDWE